MNQYSKFYINFRFLYKYNDVDFELTKFNSLSCHKKKLYQKLRKMLKT